MLTKLAVLGPTFRTLLRRLWDAARDLLPIILVISFFQIVVLQQPVPQLGQILAGGLMVLIGLSLFVQGLQLALFPLGEEMAYNFVRKGNLWLLLLFAFTLGFGTTVAEPALIAIAGEAAIIAAEGGVIENVFVRDVEIGETGSAIDIDMQYEEGADGSFMPVVRNVLVERLAVRRGRAKRDAPRVPARERPRPG